jgi:hypothetical protein
LAKQGKGDEAKEEVKADDAKVDEAKADETTADDTKVTAAASADGEDKKEETKDDEEPEPTVTHDTERKHDSITVFKRSMGLFPDTVSIGYCTKSVKL